MTATNPAQRPTAASIISILQSVVEKSGDLTVIGDPAVIDLTDQAGEHAAAAHGSPTLSPPVLTPPVYEPALDDAPTVQRPQQVIDLTNPQVPLIPQARSRIQVQSPTSTPSQGPNIDFASLSLTPKYDAHQEDHEEQKTWPRVAVGIAAAVALGFLVLGSSSLWLGDPIFGNKDDSPKPQSSSTDQPATGDVAQPVDQAPANEPAAAILQPLNPAVAQAPRDPLQQAANPPVVTSSNGQLITLPPKSPSDPEPPTDQQPQPNPAPTKSTNSPTPKPPVKPSEPTKPVKPTPKPVDPTPEPPTQEPTTDPQPSDTGSSPTTQSIPDPPAPPNAGRNAVRNVVV